MVTQATYCYANKKCEMTWVEGWALLWMQVPGYIRWLHDSPVVTKISCTVFNGGSISDEGGVDGPDRTLLGLMLAQSMVSMEPEGSHDRSILMQRRPLHADGMSTKLSSQGGVGSSALYKEGTLVLCEVYR